MCDTCPSTKKPQQVKPSLWTLAANKRCAVIGTCLEISELKRVFNRFKTITRDVTLRTDYDYHSYFVSICGDKNPLSAYLNKTLNRQYLSCLDIGRKLKTDQAIHAKWCSLDNNDLRSLSGFFWAFMTSRHASDALKDRLYGDIHMVSHIAGRSQKSSMQRLVQENALLREQVHKKEQQLAARTQQLAERQREVEKLGNQNASLGRLLQQLKFHSDFSQPRRQKYEARISEQQLAIHRLQAQLDKLKAQQVYPLQLDAQRLNDIGSDEKTADNGCDRQCAGCDKSDLCGKTILYVGGFSRHRKKFQQLTQSINGRFFYHDGGMQQNEHQLDELVKKADCVFCPVDCISHNAMGRIKNLVKQECKDCVYLKSASISAFRKEVVRYAS